MRKKCFRCGRTKDIIQFYTHKQMGDGHLGKCKSCTKKDVNDRYKDPVARERIREYEKQRSQYPERKNRAVAYLRKLRIEHRGRGHAWQQVTSGLRSGTLIRQPCEICGEMKVQGHHTDYRKPLKVRWLCFKHHREEHGQTVNK